MRSDLGKRLVVAALLIPACVVVTWTGGAVFAAGLALLAWIATREIALMLSGRGDRVMGRPASLLAAALPLSTWLFGLEALGWMIAAGWITLSGLAALRIRPADRPFLAAGLSLSAAVYCGGLLSFGLPLRHALFVDRLDATLVFFLPVALTWIIDTAAYFGGRRFGRRRLAPAISPNKTVAGTVSALVAGPLGALGWGLAVQPHLERAAGVAGLLLLGLVIAAASTIGDLAESALKRECGVKDSSGLLPGHGGLLDRLDSLLWSIPVGYLVLAVLL